MGEYYDPKKRKRSPWIVDPLTGRVLASTPEMEAAEGMEYPVVHIRCGKVMDKGKMKVVGRYADCSTWHCTGCRILVDDRAGEIGGIRKLY